jgi:carbamoyl-phosphate synthase large subunit
MKLDNKKILLTGCGGPAGVNFLKSVNELSENTKFYGADMNHFHLHLAKPYLAKDEDSDPCGFIIPRADNPLYIEALKQIIKEHEIDFISPQPDFEVKYISENREKLGCKTFLPDKEVVKNCQDKLKSAEIWHKADIPSIKPFEIRMAQFNGDLDFAFRSLGKGNGFWLRANEGAGGRGSTFCRSAKMARHWIMYWLQRGVKWKWMAQEYLPGRNIAWQGIFKDGELIVSQARERLEYIYAYLAPSGITGTPTRAKTINDDAVNEMAMDSILAIDKKPNGIYSVDLKGNKDGVIVPTEINPGRFHTTSFFYAKASKTLNIPRANMPVVFLKTAFDDPIPEGPQFDILPPDIFWLRHIDCPSILIRSEDLFIKTHEVKEDG